ncbi:MAG: four helix bundle protein [Acidobacteria bacterium]|nr:four helix bundle protein [Acidobacteriota bacterium]
MQTCWYGRKASELSVEVYRLTRSFPSRERYGLTAEIRETCRCRGSASPRATCYRAPPSGQGSREGSADPHRARPPVRGW